MTEQTSPNQFFEALNKFSTLLLERCDALEKKISTSAAAEALTNNDDQQLFEMQMLSAEELGPLYSLLKDPLISDILINDPKSVYIEKNGKLTKTPIEFESNQQLLEIARKIARASGKEFDLKRPYLDTRLIDGSRLNIVAPPLAIDGLSMSIRKFKPTMITLDNLAEFGSMDQKMADLLKICAGSRLNILVIGGTGSGKTTLLNALCEHMGADERVVTIEDAAELRLPIPHKVRLETKQRKYGESEHCEVTIRDLMVNSLRMRPDRIIVGETRGAEAFDMIQAMNTGHDGSMTTIHANSPRDGLMRLENMITVAVPTMSSLSIKQRLASAINLVVMVSRFDDGSRKVTHITEISGIEGDVIATQDLFTFEQTGLGEDGQIVGRFKNSNFMPRFAKKAAKYGFQQGLNEIFNINLQAQGKPQSGGFGRLS